MGFIPGSSSGSLFGHLSLDGCFGAFLSVIRLLLT
jgi:hypothetical protein